jgi:glycine/D-amino acid oxidase-like deaminating enzyme
MASKGVYERGYAGVYDNTPDEQPVIDELSDYGFENLFCLVGLSGHGFKLAPEFGRIMAALVNEGAFKDYDVSPFRLRRFTEGKLLKSRYEFGTIG